MLVNFSDAIAMNAKPKYVLITLSIPKDLSNDEIDILMEGFESTAREFGCEIIGGDTIGGDKLHISLTVISQSDAPLYRKGLEEGDLLAYTGILGESKRDLEKLFRGEEIAGDSRFLEPVLRAEFIERARPYLQAGMDISDGLFCDTNKLLDINKYGMNILKDINQEMGDSGEEYEMLVGFQKRDKEEILSIARALNLPLNIFAEVAKNRERFPCKSHHFQ
jgi:thiamine-monophosphate kinase